jgi:histidine ammonia-lyase
VQKILAIELLAACQSYELLDGDMKPARRTFALYKALRRAILPYADDRPLGEDIVAAAAFIRERTPAGVLSAAAAA